MRVKAQKLRSARLARQRKNRVPPKPKTLTQELDQLVRQIVLIRDGFKCQRCGAGVRPGRGKGLEVAHLMPKGAHPALRHELLNVTLLCHRCHFEFWHKSPILAFNWLVEMRGQNFVDNLRYLAQSRSHVDREAVRVYLQAQLAQLGTQRAYDDPTKERLPAKSKIR
jgi:hypothetical protein